MNNRHFLFLLFLCVTHLGMAQNNFSGFNYQAVVRNASGDPVANQSVGVRVLISEGAGLWYSETHALATDAYGQISLVMGEGTPQSFSLIPTFQDIDWGSGETLQYFIYVDATGGTNYQYLGGGAFKAVPYALHAMTSADQDTTWTRVGDDLYNANPGNVGVGTDNPSSLLQVGDYNDTTSTDLKVVTGGGNLHRSAVKLRHYSDAFGFDLLSDDAAERFQLNTVDDGVATPRLTVRRSDGKVGIGTTNPSATMDILGDLRIADGTEGVGKVLTSDENGHASWQAPMAGGSGAWAISGTHQYNTNTGNVGIGTSTPAAKLEVDSGDAIIHGITVGQGGSPYVGNLAIGHEALKLTGQLSGNNTAIGTNALRSNTDGFLNLALGPNALRSNSTGMQNIGIGEFALGDNVSGNFNVSLGVQALRGATSASSNTAIGWGAMGYGPANAGSSNTALGFLSLSQPGTGNNNTAIGAQSSVHAEASNATAIGAYAYAAGSNCLTLGSVSNFNGATQSTNVGIGTVGSSHRLEVADWDNYASLKPAATFGLFNCEQSCFSGQTTQAINLMNFSSVPGTHVGIGFSDYLAELNPSAWMGAKFVIKDAHIGDLEFHTRGMDGFLKRMTISHKGSVGINSSDTMVTLGIRSLPAHNDILRLTDDQGNVRFRAKKTGDAGFNALVDGTALNIRGGTDDLFALKVQDMLGADHLTVDNSGQVVIKGPTVCGDNLSPCSYPLFVTGSQQGIWVNLNTDEAHNGNDYMLFTDNSPYVKGSIAGQNLTELQTDPEYIFWQEMSAMNEALIIAEGAACAGQADVLEVAVMAAEGASVIGEWAVQSVAMENNVGVVFQSNSADYAEWLKRADGVPNMKPGTIVGVNNGMISMSTSGAQKIMVVSTAPLVLGNSPGKEGEEQYEKVAFMGQVPVHVRGAVNAGDYIVASGLEDGTGVGVPPGSLTADQLGRIVGVAWESSPFPNGEALINVAIGIGTDPLVDQLKNLKSELDATKGALAEVMDYLRTKDPAFTTHMAEPMNVRPDAPAPSTPTASTNGNKHTGMEEIINTLRSRPDLVSAVFDKAKDNCRKRGLNVDGDQRIAKYLDADEFMKRLNNIGKPVQVKQPVMWSRP